MGWRQELILRGVSAATAALMPKEGRNRARTALEAAFPELKDAKVQDAKAKTEDRGKGK